MKSWQNVKSLLALVFCTLFLFSSPFLTKRWNRDGSDAVICWDTYGYYLYLPSLFYDDLGRLNNYDYIHHTYHPGGDEELEAFIQPSTGKYVMNYSCGQAIMELPAFAVGHIWAKAAGYKADGFTLPYQVAVTFWCVFVACMGLWAMRRLLLRYFDDWLVAIALIVICVATNLYNFVSFSVMTHAYLFTVYAFILYLTDSFYRSEKRRIPTVIAIGLLSGLATITRPTEIICVIIPLLWGVSGWNSLKERVTFFFLNIRYALIYALSAFVVALPQLIYWKIYAGHWLFFSYHGADKTFSFRHPHILEVLFSYQKGWFVYTPVMILSVLGFYQLYKNYRSLFWCILAFSIVNLYLVSAWDCWWYGGSFSMRALIQSYALLLFPLAAFLGSVLQRKFQRYLFIVFLVFCAWLNLKMTYQANGYFKYSPLDGEGMTKAYYWRMLWKTEPTLKDKKLLDTDEEMPERLTSGLKEIAMTDSINIPAYDSVAGRRVFKLDSAKQWVDGLNIPLKGIHNGWYRVSVNCFFPKKEQKVWNQTQFWAGFYLGQNKVKQNMIRIQRITEEGLWTEVYIDIKAPREDYDSFKVIFWNASGIKPIYIDSVRVMYTPAQ